LGRFSGSAEDFESLDRLLCSLVNPKNWDDCQQIVEQHPELLAEASDSRLQDMEATEGSVGNLEVLREYRALLRRCRDVGILRAFAEKRLNTQGQGEAARRGLAPEEFLAKLLDRQTSSESKDREETSLPTEFTDNLQRAEECEQHYLRTGDLAARDNAGAALSRILNSTTQQAPEHLRLYALSHAGALFLRSYWVRGGIEDLNRAIDCCEQAVNGTPLESADLPEYLTNLGIALRERFLRTKQEASLEDAIRFFRQAVEATPQDSSYRPALLQNLGVSLAERFERTGRESHLEEAIQTWRQAVEATPPHSLKLPLRLSNFGLLLRIRFHRNGREAVLEEVIHVFRRAVLMTPPNWLDLSEYLTNLGVSLSEKFERTKQKADLDESIEILRRAVKASPRDSADLPARLNNLGSALRHRVSVTAREVDLHEAIQLHQEAVQATSPDSSDLATRLNNLGSALFAQFKRSQREADLNEAIRIWRRAVQATPTDSSELALYLGNLGNGLNARYRRAGRKADLLEGTRVYRSACELARRPGVAIILARRRGRWALERQEWQESTEAFRFGLSTGRQVLGRQLLREHQEHTLRDLQEMSSGLAYALAKLARYEDAAVVMESGRARLMAEVLQRRRRELERSAAAGDATYAQIQAAAHDTPVAYLLATSVGGLALVALADRVQPVWLDSLTDSVVREWLGGPVGDSTLRGWLGTCKGWMINRTWKSQEDWLETIDGITHQLWIHLMQPLCAALHSFRSTVDCAICPTVTLIPAGLLSLLPLHAAWAKDASTVTARRYFLDEFAVRYAPSALSLNHAQERASIASAESLLAVEEPLVDGASSLPNANAEVTAIAAMFDRAEVLARGKATREAVRVALPQADVVHFSCHGSNSCQSPLDSGLLMADDDAGANVMLTVRDLLDLEQAGGRLATLSACETGVVGMELPDEVVALPSALMQAGFSGVVASLWSVADISTAMLMEQFYARWRKDKLSPAEALRCAQRWLRDSTNKEKAEYCKRYSPELASRLRMPEGAAIDCDTDLMIRFLNDRDFAHPFWWAAFYLTGL